MLFDDDDYRAYRDLLVAEKPLVGVALCASRLMPNHVHLIVVPDAADGLWRFFAEAHRRYTRLINFRVGWNGQPWQARYHSFLMDDACLPTALRNIGRDPVRARLVERPEDWAWSSTAGRLMDADDPIADSGPHLSAYPDWPCLLGGNEDEAANDAIRLHARSGRPLGYQGFHARAEAALGRALRPRKPGPKPAP